jgi:STE24 endopeptidase
VARHRDTVPAAFAERIPLHAHRRAADYTLARVRLGVVETMVGALMLLALTVFGGIAAIAEGLRALWPDAPFLRQVLLVGAVALAAALVDLPIAAYRQFVLEARFGFNRMTPGLFVADMLKGLVLAVALGLPLVAAVLWLIERAGDAWWLWAWLVWVAFNLGVLVLFPTARSATASSACSRAAGSPPRVCSSWMAAAARRTATHTSPASAAPSGSSSSTRC